MSVRLRKSTRARTCRSFCTSYRDGGYDVVAWPSVRRYYLHGWFGVDMCASLPIDDILVAATGVAQCRWLKLLRVLRVTRVLRTRGQMGLVGANVLRVLQMLFFFVLLGHWLGLGWYVISIAPLQLEEDLMVMNIKRRMNVHLSPYTRQTTRLSVDRTCVSGSGIRTTATRSDLSTCAGADLYPRYSQDAIEVRPKCGRDAAPL